METRDYLAYTSDVIHTTVVATVDDTGLPVTAAIDMMDSDEDGLYFLTATGKSFYDRLMKRGFLALTAIRGADTMHSVAVSVRGKVRELGPDLLPRLFKKNPYMAELYPSEASRAALTVFKLYEGTGRRRYGMGTSSRRTAPAAACAWMSVPSGASTSAPGPCGSCRRTASDAAAAGGSAPRTRSSNYKDRERHGSRSRSFIWFPRPSDPRPGAARG